MDRTDGIPAVRLTSRPPLRAALLRAESAEWILVVVTHHIAVDGASVAPLLGDGARAYAARAGGVAPQWESLPLRYRDFAHWQCDCSAISTTRTVWAAGSWRTGRAP
ncbi:hypothetical protein GS448_26150 [Rhodococcus hoagii]|nr:hypothetical protein [Prescottella equi]